jgi:acetylornithine/succinyldiaminopimelate/putrescine aminotransferase/predicted amino acid dehydrogenase
MRLLRALGLDVVYDRGAGDFLVYRDAHGREIEVLDLVGGYGSLLLGHNHPELVSEASRQFASGRAQHVQGSRRQLAERLGSELARRAGDDFCVVFGNSGTEAVEAAMKHALLESRGRSFVALDRAFHGKTLGAVQLAGSSHYRAGLDLGLHVVRIGSSDVEALEDVFRQPDDIAGFIFEPIQAEGGVRPVNPAVARRAAQLCKQRGIPLIADECQTGMGRTGTFLACESLGVQPDYVILSKALGGGLAKISALLVRRQRYVDSFDLKHSSTFADDDFSCAIALKALELTDQPMLDRCRERGERILRSLRRLQSANPDIIADVRGIGLLIGMEFRRMLDSSSVFLRLLSSQEDLIYLLAAHLFHEYRIRVAPTLSDPFTLRIEPSVLIGDESIERLENSLRDVCHRLVRQDVVGLTRFLTDRPGIAATNGTGPVRGDTKLFAYNSSCLTGAIGNGPAVRVGWLCHFIDANDLATLEPEFVNLPVHCRAQFLDRFGSLACPVVMSAADIRSRTGGVVRLYPILLPVCSRTMKSWIEGRHTAMVHGLIHKGIAAARALGCSLISLGQYTSIATSGGRSLGLTDVGLTNGNSYTAALVVQAVRRGERLRSRRRRGRVLAVVGAAGSVGRATAKILAADYQRVILIGSGKPGSVQRLRKLAHQIPNAEVNSELSALVHANTAVIAVSAVEPLVGPEHFARGAFVCDVSVPSAICPGTMSLRPDLTIINGGVVQLPFSEDVGILGFPLGAGLVYGCMAEGLVLGLDGVRDATFTGSLTHGRIRFIEERAKEHGFELAELDCASVREAAIQREFHGRCAR